MMRKIEGKKSTYKEVLEIEIVSSLESKEMFEIGFQIVANNPFLGHYRAKLHQQKVIWLLKSLNLRIELKDEFSFFVQNIG